MLLLAAMFAVSAPAAEQAAIFTAAGFRKLHGRWHTDCDQAGASYEPGSIDTFRDVNGDGRPEAVVTEGGTYCYGNTGTGFWLLTRAPNGHWTVLHQSQGIAEFLPTRGVNKMPDISVGGPGFCFPVLRWNGRAYVQQRFEYEGKACRPR